jgi:hypothetical protein
MTIELSESVCHEAPAGFLVFAHKDIDADYMIFPEERDAKTYAFLQEEKANTPEGSWPVYALWASDWPLKK